MLLRVLGYLEVLAVLAAEIASHRGNRKGSRGRKKMKQGLLLYRVYIHRDHFPVHEAVQDPVDIFPDITDAPLPLLNMAMVGAEKTPHLFLPDLLVKHRFLHNSIIAPPFRINICVAGMSQTFLKTDTWGLVTIRLVRTIHV